MGYLIYLKAGNKESSSRYRSSFPNDPDKQGETLMELLGDNSAIEKCR